MKVFRRIVHQVSVLVEIELFRVIYSPLVEGFICYYIDRMISMGAFIVPRVLVCPCHSLMLIDGDGFIVSSNVPAIL